MRKLLSVLLLLISMPLIAQTCNSSITASTPDSRFVVNGQEVTDTVTGLVWKKCSLGQSGSNCSGTALARTWAEALQAAADQRFQTGQYWRLPNINELRSIVEEQCSLPAINETVFPNTGLKIYWSASINLSNTMVVAWVVKFTYGEAIYDLLVPTTSNDVRLVRTGQ